MNTACIGSVPFESEKSIPALRRSFCRSMQHEDVGDFLVESALAIVLPPKLSDDVGHQMKQDSLENFKSRLKKTSGFQSSELKNKPVIARHPSETQLTDARAETGKTHRMSIRTCRTPSPGQNCRRNHSPGFLAVSPRRRSSPSWKSGFSRPCSPSCSNAACRRRLPSPCASSCCSLAGVPGDATEAERIAALNRRVRKAQRARFYLLQRPGPHSFAIGGDLPAKNKYKIIIGPQTCTCGHGPHCVHILFIMLRVFQISENDPRLVAKDLKNFEVESLFAKFDARRKYQVGRKTAREKSGCDVGHPNGVRTGVENSAGSEHSSSLRSRRISGVDDEELDLCPICLLEMVEGEGLTTCKNGCKNQLHYHCIAIWAEECRSQGERVLCPLCRALWHDPPGSPQSSSSGVGSSVGTDCSRSAKSIVDALVSPGLLLDSAAAAVIGGRGAAACRKKTSWPWRSSSSSSVKGPEASLDGGIGADSGVALVGGCVPLELRAKASSWSRIFGAETTSNLFSREWGVREAALRQLNRHLTRILTAAPGAFSVDWVVHVLKCAVCVLAVLAPDPVYKVYVGCMRVLRTVLSSPHVVDAASAANGGYDAGVLRMLQPVLNSVILKCADSNRRMSQLSLATLVELGRGAEGQLGAFVAVPGVRTAVEAVLDCVIQDSFPDGALEWQWILGRLLALEHLVSVFPQEFTIEYVPLNDGADSEACDGEESGFVLRNFNKILAVQDFAGSAVSNPHAVVARTARRLFVSAAQMCCDEPAAYNEVCVMLSRLEPNLRQRLQKKIKPSNAACVPPVEDPPAAIEKPSRGGGKSRGFSARLLSPSPRRRHGLCRLVVSSGAAAAAVDGRGALARALPALLGGDERAAKTTTTAAFGSREDVAEPVGLGCDDDHREDDGGDGDGDDVSPGGDDYGDRAPLLPRPTHLPLGVQPQGKQKRARWFQFQKMHLTRGHHGHNQQQQQQQLSNCQPPEETTKALPGMLTEVKSNVPVLDAAAAGIRRRFRSGASAAAVREERKPPAEEAEDGCDEGGGGEGVGDVVVHCVRAEVVPLRRAGYAAQVLPSLPVWRPRDGAVLPIEPDVPGGNGVEDAPSYVEGRDWLRGPLLGTGAFSSVFQAWDVATGTIMAVKQVSLRRNSKEERDQVEENMRAEISLMMRLNHANIVRITGACREGPTFNVFSEWMSGGSIANLLEKFGAFSERVIVRYVRQVLDGLAFLHDSHVLHRDLKGANLLVDKDGRTVKIGDFGAATHLMAAASAGDGDGAETGSGTGTGTVSGELQGQLTGTVAFMAPEVLRGEHYGRRCDVWSVGCCVIEMATAKPPWDQPRLSNHLALMFKIACTDKPPPLPETLSPLTRSFALSCLELDASARPSARELLGHPVFRDPDLDLDPVSRAVPCDPGR